MVAGLNKFREYFRNYPGNYIVIGGTACNIIIGKAGLIPRVTKDIDLILIVEALSKEFVSEFWNFIRDGQYQKKEKDPEQRKYYRFEGPLNQEFPKQVELFSRKPDIIELYGSPHLTPVPIDGDLSSLSAILLNDEYYHFTLEHSTRKDEVHLANIEGLICLKAKAFLEMTARKNAGKEVSQKQIDKHKNDVFRLSVLLSPSDSIELPAKLKTDMQTFLESVKNDLPYEAIFKESGAGKIDVNDLLKRLINALNIG
ncbi:MAG: hypothetical protein FJY10_05365 [Bacteroidetes bacterium]|nr:hypothetical protein [Bacteroidota bacterium]